MIIFSNLINVNNIILQKELKHNNNLIFIPIQYKYDSFKKLSGLDRCSIKDLL